MRKFYIIGFAILLCFDTVAQTSFKLAAVDGSLGSLDLNWLTRLLAQPWIYAGILAYLGAFGTYMTVLKRAPVGPAFAATHLEIVTVSLVSVFLLHEKLTALQLFGSLFIMLGIYLLGTEKQPELISAIPNASLAVAPPLVVASNEVYENEVVASDAP